MKKTWQLRACAVYMTLGASVAASCAREANTLDDDGAGNTGGSTTKAGSSSSTAGNKSAFGGTSAKAGAGSGGKGGTTSQGGVTSAAGTAGGGSVGVPPDVLERASAIVYYETTHTAASDGTIQMKLKIKNQSDDPLPMASVKIRYWFTAEVTPTLHQYYTGDHVRPAMAAFVDEGDASHALMTFGGGSIAKGEDINFSEVQLEMTNNTGKFDQADDFSWQPTSTTSMPNGKITLYLDDQLIWGCEPSGACFDGGMGGAGSGGSPGTDGAGAGGAPSAGGAPDTGGAPDAGGAPGTGGVP
jgi:hypothetical protein